MQHRTALAFRVRGSSMDVWSIGIGTILLAAAIVSLVLNAIVICALLRGGSREILSVPRWSLEDEQQCSLHDSLLESDGRFFDLRPLPGLPSPLHRLPRLALPWWAVLRGNSNCLHALLGPLVPQRSYSGSHGSEQVPVSFFMFLRYITVCRPAVVLTHRTIRASTGVIPLLCIAAAIYSQYFAPCCRFESLWESYCEILLGLPYLQLHVRTSTGPLQLLLSPHRPPDQCRQRFDLYSLLLHGVLLLLSRSSRSTFTSAARERKWRCR